MEEEYEDDDNLDTVEEEYDEGSYGSTEITVKPKMISHNHIKPTFRVKKFKVLNSEKVVNSGKQRL